MTNPNHSRQNAHRPLLETLESRQLFSGNIAVTYDAATDTYSLAGDTRPNAVFVSQNVSETKYAITGLSGTTINGKASIVVGSTPGNPSAFRVGLGQGNDFIQFDEGLYHDIDVYTTFGDDDVRVIDTEIWGHLNIETGSGADTVDILRLRVSHDLTISTGSGDDYITLLTSIDDWVTGDAVINGGVDDDTLFGVLAIVNVDILNIETIHL